MPLLKQNCTEDSPIKDTYMQRVIDSFDRNKSYKFELGNNRFVEYNPPLNEDLGMQLIFGASEKTLYSLEPYGEEITIYEISGYCTENASQKKVTDVILWDKKDIDIDQPIFLDRVVLDLHRAVESKNVQGANKCLAILGSYLCSPLSGDDYEIDLGKNNYREYDPNGNLRMTVALGNAYISVTYSNNGVPSTSILDGENPLGKEVSMKDLIDATDTDLTDYRNQILSSEFINKCIRFPHRIVAMMKNVLRYYKEQEKAV